MSNLDCEPDRMADPCPEGDVVLIVGASNVRLRVHSRCLRSASKTFGVMFGPHFSEGQNLSSTSPTEVPLPDDDAEAMRTICYIVHHRNDLVPQHLTAQEILRIAIEVDKYDLKIALKYASLEWLKTRPNLGRKQMGNLLAAAFLFDNTDSFNEHSLALILNYSGSYLDFFDDDFTSEVLPARVFGLLEERRTRFRAELCDILIKGKEDACKCGWGKIRGEKYEQLLAEYTPIKMLDTPMAEIIAKMERVFTEDMCKMVCREKTSYRTFHHDPLPANKTLRSLLDGMKNKARITIDTVRSIRSAEV